MWGWDIVKEDFECGLAQRRNKFAHIWEGSRKKEICYRGGPHFGEHEEYPDTVF